MASWKHNASIETIIDSSTFRRSHADWPHNGKGSTCITQALPFIFTFTLQSQTLHSLLLVRAYIHYYVHYCPAKQWSRHLTGISVRLTAEQIFLQILDETLPGIIVLQIP